MTFCTSIHCMDGRIQEPIVKYLKGTYGVDYVDAITEAGPCKILAENEDTVSVGSIMARANISVHKHGSRLIAVSGHYDCAGNPCDDDTQKQQIKKSVELLKSNFPEVEVVGLWIDSEWKVSSA